MSGIIVETQLLHTAGWRVEHETDEYESLIRMPSEYRVRHSFPAGFAAVSRVPVSVMIQDEVRRQLRSTLVFR